MSAKRSKFGKDLDRLIQKGELLDSAIRHDCFGEEFEETLRKSNSKETVTAYLNKLPDFKQDYQAWYTEAHALLKQTLLDRVQDFESYYKYPRVRKEITFENYMIRDYLQGLCVSRGTGFNRKIIVDGSAAIPEFQQQLNIVRAAKSTLTSTLIDLTLILQADLFDSEIDSADAISKVGYFRAAGAICGVVIEKHLKAGMQE